MTSASNFTNPYSADVIGLWDFLRGSETKDTGLDDGIAQNGEKFGYGQFSNGYFKTDGRSARFDVQGNDTPFDLAAGTVMVQFEQTGDPGWCDDYATVVSRGEKADAGKEGFFEVRVTETGAVQVLHADDCNVSLLSTAKGFAGLCDEIRVTYSWDAATGNKVLVENLTDGTSFTGGSEVTGLTFDITDNDGQSFTIGAEEKDDGKFDHYFDGHIDYLAILDGAVLFDPALDGVVEGTDGDDLIDLAYTGDPEGDRIDNGDAILPGQAPDDDIVDAGAGDDTVRAGEGNDTIYAGSGSDTVEGGAGDDVIYGDSNLPGGDFETGREVFRWSEGPGFSDERDAGGFTQNTGSVDVSFSILNSYRHAQVEWESDDGLVEGIDTGDLGPVNPDSNLAIETEKDCATATVALEFSEAVGNVSFRINDADHDSVVSVRAYDAEGHAIAVELTGGSGLILSDKDAVPGDDTATSKGGGAAPDSAKYSLLVGIDGPVSKIVITHTNDGGDSSHVQITDVYFDAGIADEGAPGDDVLLGGAGDDTIFGEGGDDTITGGEGADRLSGGDDADTFIVDAATGKGDVIDGGSGGNDHDTLEIAGDFGTDFRFTDLVTDSDGNGFDGTVEFLDGDGDVTGTLKFTNIEVVPCFTPGTRIATPQGARPVEDLRQGDRVLTRDNGIREIGWLGHKTLNAADLTRAEHLRPVLIRKGALGDGLPEREMMVSPNHRMLVSNDKTALYFAETEVLAAAKHLTGLPGVETVMAPRVTYIHFMFDQHEVVLSDGSWSESFQPGDQSLQGVGNAQRNEIYELFPELKTQVGINAYQAARKSLKRHEARLLTL